LTPADRAHLLSDRLAILEPGGSAVVGSRAIDDPIALACALAADRVGRAAIARLLPGFLLREPGQTDAHASPIRISEPPGEITLVERWRLVLGVTGSKSPRGKLAANTLDQLYGASAREGRGQTDDLAGGGGTEAASPSAREWINDVNGLFGKEVFEEVLGEAAAGGRTAILEHLDPTSVRPSIALLEQVLSLRGALPERELARLRRLARSITERLAQQLADRLRPALSGLSTARPTRRRSRRLHFARTLEANLDTAYRRSDGRIALAPRRLIFHSPARRQMDWHLIFVVDVSGSMEASVIYSALVSAIFSALPAIDVRFFVFSTEVIDFSNAVDDPLALLMEVQVGGGTHIGLGLRVAREAIKNPSRTMVVLVTDFEEGVSVPEMLAEIRALADSGARLLGLAALDDEAKPRYHAGNAASAVSAGMPVAAVSPERLAQWVGDQIRRSSS
jgi:Mg-chelatase subunit ChlD